MERPLQNELKHLGILNLLGEHRVNFRAVQHSATRTSVESAAARGEPLEIGGKALLLKVGDSMRLFVLSAARKLDMGSIKSKFAEKRLRFASVEELWDLTELQPGAVPPFGPPILPFELFIDESISQNEKIAFNAASLTDSIVMSVNDYLRIANGEVFSFSCPG